MRPKVYLAARNLGLSKRDVNKILSKSTFQKTNTATSDVYKAGTRYGTVCSKDVYKAGTRYGTICIKDF